MGDWPYWVFGGLTLLAGVTLAAWSILGDRSRGRLRCPRCWYDMGGVSVESDGRTRCPECGAAIASARRLRRTRRRWGRAIAGVFVAVAGAGVVDYPNLRAGGWHQRLPTTALILLLPPYSPELNPIERLWASLRAHFLSNRAYDDYDHLLDAGAEAWQRLTPQRLRSVCACSYTTHKPKV